MFSEISRFLEKELAAAKTMWDKADPRISSNGSFVDGHYLESPADKEKRENTQKLVKNLEALKKAGFTYMVVCLKDGDIVSVRFHKKADGGAYIFENGSLLLTSEGLDKHHNGIVSAEQGEWVIAEFQDGAIDAEILKKFCEVDDWHVCINHE